ncbi:MAG: hypothetical protein ACW991_09125 [Candidatus Hodarchaeales archaeon]|jgi:hypothetical protein
MGILNATKDTTTTKPGEIDGAGSSSLVGSVVSNCRGVTVTQKVSLANNESSLETIISSILEY